MIGIFPLKGTVKNYDWGGHSFIPHLLAQPNIGQQPFAEYWMGVHPSADNRIFVNEHWIPLKEKAASLPFLLKLLDVKNMLSIQVHPDIQGAKEGFQRENELGIPLDAPNRNYRDINHKPEMMVALSDFWLLHGFKPVEEMTDILTNRAFLNEFLPLFSEKGYQGLYHHIMRSSPEQIEKYLQPLRDELSAQPALHKNEEDFWAARAFETNGEKAVRDAGIFSIYLFNLVHLKKGEGIFQGAGLPHAYLEGKNVEIMANSDNVLRGGLTSKNIDVTELLRHVKCEATYPHILAFDPAFSEQNYPSPVPDFSLRSFHLQKGKQLKWRTEKPSILLVTEGKLMAGAIPLSAGSPSAFLEKGVQVMLEAADNCTAFLAS